MPQKYFFFDRKVALLLLGIIFLSSAGIIQEASASQVISTERFRDYQVETLDDGTIRQTLGMPPYVWNGSEWVDRIVQNNGTHFNVYSEMGSFSFNKSTCMITQYSKGFDPTSEAAGGTDVVIGNWYWTIARKSGAAPWSVVDPMIFGCSISASSNATGKYLSMQRTHGTGSYLRVDIAGKNDVPVEDFGKLYMNVPAWNGDKFAPVLYMKAVKADTITFRNGTEISIPQGVSAYDKSQLTVSSLDFIRNGNPFFFDWQKMIPQFQTMYINRTGGTVDMRFDFTKNATSLNVGQSMSWDPTYGYTTGTYKFMNKDTNANCNVSGVTAFDGGAYSLFTSRERSDGFGACEGSAIRWNISTIPVGYDITNATIRYDLNSVTSGINCNWNEMNTDPNTGTAAQLYDDAWNIGGGNTFVSNDALCTSTGNNKVVVLNSAGRADIRSQLASGWWAVGFVYTDPVRDATYRETSMTTAAGGATELQITYSNNKQDAVTTLAASGTTVTATDLSWSAPDLHGSTLQRYVINYTTPCGTPNTHLANGTTATSYTVSSLVAATCYSFRVSAATEFGYNITGANIVNATTLAFTEANYTIGYFNYDAQNPVRLPIRYERIDNGTQTMVNVTFSSTVSLACDLKYTYAMTNQTYHTIPYSTISSTEKESSFQFTNSSNDIVTFHCWDQAGNQSANYVMTQTHFLLLQQIEEFRNGTYGTMGQLGAFDFITLIVVIIAMIGFNQKTESVAGFFCIVAVSVMAYFGIISWLIAVVSGLAVVIMLMMASTRKE